jgi:protease I
MMIFVEDGVEDSEFIYPYYRFQEEGYKMDVVAPKAKETYHGKYGVPFTSDISASEVNLNEYDAIIIPGGKAPDRLRMHKDLVDIVREANNAGKVIASICHGPQMLIEADIVRGRTVTSYQSVRTDLKNAGANVVDESVVIDGTLVTSRMPADLPNFCKATLKVLSKLQKVASAVEHSE